MKTPTIKDIRAAAAARRDRRRWLNRLTGGAITVAALAVILMIFILPAVVRSQIETKLRQVFGTEVAVGEVEVNLLTLSVTMHDTAILDQDGAPLFSWDRLRVNGRAWALVRGRAGFDVIELDGFRGKVAIDSEGGLNFASIFAGPSTGEQANDAGPLVWEIGVLTVSQAQVDFVDQSHTTPFSTLLGPVSFSLRDFHTRGDAQAPYHFDATTEAGEGLSWRGTLSLTPLRSKGTVLITEAQLPKYAPYYAEAVNFDLRAGFLSGSAEYDLDFGGDESVVRVHAGSVHVRALALSNRGSSDTAAAAELVKLTDVIFDATGSSLDFGQVEWVGGKIVATRDEAGIDLLGWGGVKGDASSEPNLTVKFNRIASEGMRLEWRDLSMGRVIDPISAMVKFELSELDLSKLGQKVGIDLAMSFIDGGQVRMSGESVLEPFRPTLTVDVDAFSLSSVNPYLQSAIKGQLSGGTLGLHGNLGTVGDGVMFRGDAGVAAIKLVTLDGEQIASWENLIVNGLSYASNPASLAIKSARWIRPEGRLRIRRDGTLNWTNIAASAESAVEPAVQFQSPAVQAKPVDETELRVDRLELVEAYLKFEDESLPKLAQLNLTELSGTLLGLSSSGEGKAKAELR